MTDGRVRLAERMIAARSYRPASQVLREHLRYTPDDLRARSLLGLAAFRLGDHTVAEQAFRTVLESKPDDVPTLYNLGVTLERLGRTDEGRSMIARAAALDPGYQPAQERLAGDRSRPRPATAASARPGDEPERLTPGEKLHTGTRRLSSFLGAFVLAVVIAGVGALIVATDRPGRLTWLGNELTFPPPSFRASVLKSSRGGPLEASARADYDQAVRHAAALADRLDWILMVAGGGLIVLALLLIVRSVLASAATRYEIFERRIDVASGVLHRRLVSAWLFQIEDVQIHQSPWLTLSGNAEIRIRLQDNAKVRIVGLGTLAQRIQLRADLRDSSLRERRALKQIWV